MIMDEMRKTKRRDTKRKKQFGKQAIPGNMNYTLHMRYILVDFRY